MAADTAEVIILVTIGLVAGSVLAFFFFKNRFGTWKALYELESKDIVTKELERKTNLAVNGSRYALRGKIAEKLAPLAPEFVSKFDPSDAHFLGMPVDYLIFKNLSKLRNNEAELLEIIFLEVKTGNGQLSPAQIAVREAINNHRMKFDTLRLPDDGA